jgi:hypothetical protein
MHGSAAAAGAGKYRGNNDTVELPGSERGHDGIDRRARTGQPDRRGCQRLCRSKEPLDSSLLVGNHVVDPLRPRHHDGKTLSRPKRRVAGHGVAELSRSRHEHKNRGRRGGASRVNGLFGHRGGESNRRRTCLRRQGGITPDTAKQR